MIQSRKKFLANAAAGSAALLLSSFKKMSLAEMPVITASKGFDVKIMASNWGIEGTIDAFCEKAKAAGYDGVELWWSADSKVQEEVFAALKKHGLEIGFLCGGYQPSPEEHLSYFKKMIDAATGQKKQRPLYINCHSGKDYFSFDDNSKFINYTSTLAKQTGINIYHETHRGRMLFNAPLTRKYIKKHPDLKLTLDISHWCCVHESLLADQKETVQLALDRAEHIHARVGHAEGPQVSDPRAPEWENAVKAHIAWWDYIVATKKAKGEVITFLTEFGPPDYMPTMPYSRKPLAELWDVNVYMLQLLKKRYA